jgi:glycosyltransferase involved in cell wall biosynthesis
MISIIVPIYNAADYLEKCVTSLLHQTEQDLQIILVDDGSTDRSRPILETFARQDERIILLQQPHAGQSAARNRGLQHATGEYIAFVDADDSLEPDWCERHLQAIADVDYVQSGYKRIQDSEFSSQKTPHHRLQFTSPCMRLYRREAIAAMQFTEGMIYEDVVWSVDLWLRDLRYRRIPYAGYRYTLNPRSTTSRRHPEAEQRLFAALKQRVPQASGRGKLIILYTIIRIKLYFIKQ